MEKGKKLLGGQYTQYTPTGKSLFVKANRYFKEAQKGDVIYFYSKSMGRVSHVGIVVDVSATTVTTVEGNTSPGTFNRNGGQVAKKQYSKNDTKIDGYGRPFFGVDTCDVQTFVDTAIAELGYIEKASNNDLDDKLKNAGDKNYTKYGAWYGGNGLYWCQQFVSWCAYTACNKYAESKKEGWEKRGEDWYYYKNGELVKDKWEKINDRFYVFDNSAKAVKGWFNEGINWYYMNTEDCTMCASQWVEDKGKWYYMDKTGKMAKDCYIKSTNAYHYVNSEGVYIKDKDTKEVDSNKHKIIKEF